MPAQINPKFLLSVGWSQRSISLRGASLLETRDEWGEAYTWILGRGPKQHKLSKYPWNGWKACWMIVNVWFGWIWTLDLDVKLTLNLWIHYSKTTLKSSLYSSVHFQFGDHMVLFTQDTFLHCFNNFKCCFLVLAQHLVVFSAPHVMSILFLKIVSNNNVKYEKHLQSKLTLFIITYSWTFCTQIRAYYSTCSDLEYFFFLNENLCYMTREKGLCM